MNSKKENYLDFLHQVFESLETYILYFSSSSVSYFPQAPCKFNPHYSFNSLSQGGGGENLTYFVYEHANAFCVIHSSLF